MLKQRIITALVLLPAVFLLLFRTPLDFFSGAILVIVYLMALEWAKLSGLKSALSGTIFALLVSIINLSIWYLGESIVVWPSPSWPYFIQSDLPLVFLLLSTFVIFLAILIVLTYSKNTSWWQKKPIRELFGLILLPTFFIAFISIRNTGYLSGDYLYGGSLLLFMLLLIWAADTGAFFTGKMFGKTKLAKVSPNKTWEGVAGGLIFSLAIGYVGISVLDLNVDNLAIYLLVVFFIGIISVFGDLFESALKRVSNIKDSGKLLPGHGGLLDRLDSTITVAPIFYLTFSYFEWFHA